MTEGGGDFGDYGYEYSGIRKMDWEYLNIDLGHLASLARSEKVDSFELLLKALDNPVRGIMELDEEKLRFKDVLSKKERSLSEARWVLRDHFDQSAYECLWRLAVSDKPGPDINWKALDVLQQVIERFPDKALDKLKETALSSTGKEALVAARVYSLHSQFPSMLDMTEEESSKVEKLADRASDYNTAFLREASREFSERYSDALRNFAGVEMYRLLLERVSGEPDWESTDALISWAENSVSKRIDKIKRREKTRTLGRGEATLGIELQGVFPESVETLDMGTVGKGITYKKFSPKDYGDVRMAGNFIYSSDEYWELSTLPTKDPIEICLIIQSLAKMGLVKPDGKSVSMHVTIGGLEVWGRSAHATQFLILASDYARGGPWITEKRHVRVWYAGGKLSVSIRGSDIEPVAGKLPSQGAAEMRLFALDNPESAYRTLFNIKFLGDLAIEKQNQEEGKPFSAAQVAVWDYVMVSADKVFQKNGLPSLKEPWTFKDLQRLNSLVAHKKAFSAEIRSLIKQARAAVILGEVIDTVPVKTNKIKGEYLREVAKKVTAKIDSTIPLGSLKNKLMESLIRELQSERESSITALLRQGSPPILSFKGNEVDLAKVAVSQWLLKRSKKVVGDDFYNKVLTKLNTIADQTPWIGPTTEI